MGCVAPGGNIIIGNCTINYVSNVAAQMVRHRPPPDGILLLFYVSHSFLKGDFCYGVVLEIYLFV
jgi:hypothetical protein